MVCSWRVKTVNYKSTEEDKCQWNDKHLLMKLKQGPAFFFLSDSQAGTFLPPVTVYTWGQGGRRRDKLAGWAGGGRRQAAGGGGGKSTDSHTAACDSSA